MSSTVESTCQVQKPKTIPTKYGHKAYHGYPPPPIYLSELWMSSIIGLAADGAKLAMWNLYMVGYRLVGFIHDEVSPHTRVCVLWGVYLCMSLEGLNLMKQTQTHFYIFQSIRY